MTALNFSLALANGQGSAGQCPASHRVKTTTVRESACRVAATAKVIKDTEEAVRHALQCIAFRHYAEARAAKALSDGSPRSEVDHWLNVASENRRLEEGCVYAASRVGA